MPSKIEIKNKEELCITKSREVVLELVETGISSVLPRNLMEKSVAYSNENKTLSIFGDKFKISGRIFVIGFGKASGRMAETIEEILGADEITAGLVNCTTTDYSTKKIRINLAYHPVPSKEGVEGTRKMLEIKEKYSLGPEDLVICLISGGGSALLPFPVKGISLEEKQITTKVLLGSGADIHEINAVRKHISRVKGGQLGLHFYPTPVISLIISDVIGNDLDVIASGPTTPDSSTFEDAYNVLKIYGVSNRIPASVVEYIRKGNRGDAEVEETPVGLSNCKNYIIGENRVALDAMFKKAEIMGFKPTIITSEQKGETTEAAKIRAAEILKGLYSDYDIILLGGETTPVLPKEHGKGGRNQHYAAVSMVELKDFYGEWVVSSVGTDGSDFSHEVAGAIVDRTSVESMWKEGIVEPEEYLKRYDSNTLLNRIGHSLIITGNTGTNVSDIVVYFLRKEVE